MRGISPIICLVCFFLVGCNSSFQSRRYSHRLYVKTDQEAVLVSPTLAVKGEPVEPVQLSTGRTDDLPSVLPNSVSKRTDKKLLPGLRKKQLFHQPTHRTGVKTSIPQKSDKKLKKVEESGAINILSFIFGLLGFFTLFAITAIILGSMGIRQDLPQKKLGIAGTILGGIFILAAIIAVIIALVLIF